jgi:hypothetical protein
MLRNFAESIYLSNISDDKQIDSFTKYTVVGVMKLSKHVVRYFSLSTK